MEAGAAQRADLALRRLRVCPRRALLRDGGDRRVPGRACVADDPGAENVCGDGVGPRSRHRALTRNERQVTRPLFEPTPIVRGIERRLFLRQTLSLGALTLLTGCDISDQEGVQKMLHAMSRWNDKVQAFLFSGQTLAPTFAESDVVHDFRYNAFFPAADAPKLSPADYRLELSGLIADKRPWNVEQIPALPQE